MNGVDFIIVGILLGSSSLSMPRGFVSEFMSLVTWLVAIVVATMAAPHAAPYLADTIEVKALRLGAAFFGVFVATLFVAGLVNGVIRRVISANGMSGFDRVLGLLFGFTRGVLIVSLTVFLTNAVVGQVVELPEVVWWRESVLIPHFQGLGQWLERFLPADIGAVRALVP